MADSKQEMMKNLEHFVIQCKSDGMKTGCYINYYKGLNSYVSYGIGARTYIPWMAFTGDKQKVPFGIYPVFLYYTHYNVLILAYGISATNPPAIVWPKNYTLKTIGTYLESRFGKVKINAIRKYNESYVFRVYEDTDNIDYAQAVEDLDSLIDYYKRILVANSLKGEIPFSSDSSHGRSIRDFFDESQFEAGKETFSITPAVRPVVSSAQSEFSTCLERYVRDLPIYWKEEKYKWQAVQHFQKNWDIDAADFGEMLRQATSRHGNLLASGNYFPIKMLLEFCKIDQEKVRSMMQILFDEKEDLVARISLFQDEAEDFRLQNEDEWSNHYQDLRAISVYLMFRYPEKYYIYKYRELKYSVEKLRLNFDFKGKNEAAFYQKVVEQMQKINTEIKNDDRVQGTLSTLLDSDCYSDKDLHVATVDFIFYTGKRMSEIDTVKEPEIPIVETPNPSAKYWLYAPGEGARKWQECQDESMMLIGWDEIGDFTRFSNFAEITNEMQQQYGGTGSYMNDRLAVWQFCHEVRPGDIVFAKRGTGLIVGRGVIEGGYVYDESRAEYRNYRKIRWTHVGEWEAPYRMNQKTLTGITSYKELVKSLEDLLSPVKKLKQIPFDMSTVKQALLDTGLLYSPQLIERYACSLLTKPFVILSGLAGSGKTQLALAFARVMCENPKLQICMVPVGADWTNREPLLGFPNALKEGEYMLPESGALQIMMRAHREPTKPFFLILDEMNLSYVERYFADFLSALESHEEIPLWDCPEDCDSEVPARIAIPSNLMIIGTINVDETTYMFSPKVLDRASVIEFKVADDEMEQFLTRSVVVDVHRSDNKCANMGEDFMRIAEEKSLSASALAQEALLSFFRVLKKVNAEFGYRSATEIYRFIAICQRNTRLTEDEILDAAIVQKLLPKLHGSRQKLSAILKELWKLCGSQVDLDEAENTDDCKYKLSADKILRMYRSALKDGFTSFAEA